MTVETFGTPSKEASCFNIGITAVRERAPYVYKMVYDLKQQGFDVTVIWDDDREGNAISDRMLWERTDRKYGVVFEDDMIIPDSFLGNLKGITEHMDDDRMAIGFMMTTFIKEGTWPENARWLEVNGGTSQCMIGSYEYGKLYTSMSKTHIDKRVWTYPAKFDREARKKVGNKRRPSHDELHGLIHLILGKKQQIVMPSIVQHIDGPSAVGYQQRMFGKARQSEHVAQKVLDWEKTAENVFIMPKRFNWSNKKLMVYASAEAIKEMGW